MRRIERWLRIHVLRQQPEWHEVSLHGDGVTVMPLSAEFVAGRNTDDLVFADLEAGSTVEWIEVGGRRFDLGGEGDVEEITISPSGWLRL